VATPIEQKVNGVEGMIYMSSSNSSDGRMSLDVSFEVDSDLDMANVLTQNRVSKAQATLPEEVKHLGVTVRKKLAFPLPQSARATLIPTLTVPVSLIGALAVSHCWDLPSTPCPYSVWSWPSVLSSMTRQAVTAKMEKGMSAHDATVEAMREVS
jgi:multidrug efflux pump subunit AcrB